MSEFQTDPAALGARLESVSANSSRAQIAEAWPPSGQGALRLAPGAHRPRRLRRTAALRDLVRETTLAPDDLVYPLFVVPGEGVRRPIVSMPGIDQLSVDALGGEARELDALGIKAVLLFGIPAEKDPQGLESFAEDGVVQHAVRALKEASPELVVMTDVCLCEYTDHGHCGLLDDDGYVLNDETLEVLGRIALSHAEAGVDVVAPSGMIDGMVGAIRSALDGEGHERVGVLSYAVKYASAFYGPFRDAAEGAPQFGDRKSHQMDPANAREALREAALDVEQGADALMVKPAIGYLDVVASVHETFPELPLAAYNVSGEYAMVKAAAANGWLDERQVVLEMLTGIRRAGADLIVTYHAKDAADWLRG
jgi:porphobilinogen synthase